MSRSVKEWIAAHDDQAIPPRVKLRIYDRDGGKCHICGLPIKPGETWDADHLIALVNGGRHAEANLAPAHKHCHVAKSVIDIKTKAKIAAVRKKHLGIKAETKPIASPGFAKAQKQAKTSRWDWAPKLASQLYQEKEG